MKIAHIETFTNEFVCFVKVHHRYRRHCRGVRSPLYYADITAQIVHRQVAPLRTRQSALDIDYLVDLIPEKDTSSPVLPEARSWRVSIPPLWDLRGRLAGKTGLATLRSEARPRTSVPMLFR